MAQVVRFYAVWSPLLVCGATGVLAGPIVPSDGHRLTRYALNSLSTAVGLAGGIVNTVPVSVLRNDLVRQHALSTASWVTRPETYFGYSCRGYAPTPRSSADIPGHNDPVRAARFKFITAAAACELIEALQLGPRVRVIPERDKAEEHLIVISAPSLKQIEGILSKIRLLDRSKNRRATIASLKRQLVRLNVRRPVSNSN